VTVCPMATPLCAINTTNQVVTAGTQLCADICASTGTLCPTIPSACHRPACHHEQGVGKRLSEFAQI
jgi:hypothetical protein